MKAKKLRCGQSVDIFLKQLKSVEVEIFYFFFSFVCRNSLWYSVYTVRVVKTYIHNSVKLTLSNMFSKN
jgi:hypothetical protein